MSVSAPRCVSSRGAHLHPHQIPVTYQDRNSEWQPRALNAVISTRLTWQLKNVYLRNLKSFTVIGFVERMHCKYLPGSDTASFPHRVPLRWQRWKAGWEGQQCLQVEGFFLDFYRISLIYLIYVKYFWKGLMNVPQDLTDSICFQVKLPALRRIFLLFLFTWVYSFESICGRQTMFWAGSFPSQHRWHQE